MATQYRQYGILITSAELAALRAGEDCEVHGVPPDQLAELEVGCETWPIGGNGDERGQMTVWPNGRGAVMRGGMSDWGDWDAEEGVLTLDATDDDGQPIRVGWDGETIRD